MKGSYITILFVLIALQSTKLPIKLSAAIVPDTSIASLIKQAEY